MLKLEFSCEALVLVTDSRGEEVEEAQAAVLMEVSWFRPAKLKLCQG